MIYTVRDHETSTKPSVSWRDSRDMCSPGGGLIAFACIVFVWSRVLSYQLYINTTAAAAAAAAAAAVGATTILAA